MSRSTEKENARAVPEARGIADRPMESAYRIDIPGMGCSVDAAPDAPMLDALLDGDIDYPHGCTNGLCSLCKSRLIEGELTHLESYASALSDEERDAGLFLPCCALARSNCVISPVQQDALLPPVRSIQGIVTAAAALTHDIIHLELTPDSAQRFEFLPGQYVELSLGDLPAREFSIASVPGERTIDFLIRKLPGGEVTALLDPERLVGTRAHVKGPYGTAYLREAHLGPMLAIAGGSGLAPIRSIVRAAVERGMKQQIRVYLGVRAERDVYLEAEFRELCAAHPGVTFEVILSSEPLEGRRSGMIHDTLRSDLAGMNLQDHMAYIAGPPVMVDAVSSVLLEQGLPAEKRQIDPFLTRMDRARSRNIA